MKDKIEMVKINRNRKKQVTIHNKITGEEKDFDSLKEASEFLGYSPNYLSSVISGKRKNATKYLFSID